MPASFQIFVRNLYNTSISLNISPDDTIHTVKEHIQAKEGIPIQLQRLVFQGKELRGGSSVQETQLNKDDTVYLLLSLKGGGNAKSIAKIESLEKKYDYNAHSQSTTCLTISNDAKYIISGSLDGTVTIFDTETKQCIIEPLHLGEVANLAITKDKRYIVSSSYCRKKILKVTEFNNLKASSSEIREVSATTSMEITKDDRNIVCGKSDGSLMVYSLSSKRCVFVIKGFLDDAITSLLLRGNLVICGSMMVKVFSLASRKCLRIFKDFSASNTKTKKMLAVSENGKYIVQAGYDRCVRVLNTFSGECIKKIYHADDNLIQSVAISKNNKFFLILNNKAVIKFFDLLTGKCMSVFTRESSVNPDFPLLKLAQNNQYLALADWKGDIKVLSVVGRNILTEEQKPLLHDELTVIT